jgi:hypothetical protein
MVCRVRVPLIARLFCSPHHTTPGPCVKGTADRLDRPSVWLLLLLPQYTCYNEPDGEGVGEL